MARTEAQRAYGRAHYLANKQIYLDREKARKRRLEQWLRELKEASPCLDCRQPYPYYVMDFDHRQGEDKEGLIANLLHRASKSRIEAEIAKCDIVCSNCHRVRTHKRLYGETVDAPHSKCGP